MAEDFTLDELLHTPTFVAAAARMQVKYSVDGQGHGFDQGKLTHDLSILSSGRLLSKGAGNDPEIKNASTVLEKMRLLISKGYLEFDDNLNPDKAAKSFDQIHAANREIFTQDEINKMIWEAKHHTRAPETPVAASVAATSPANAANLQETATIDTVITGLGTVAEAQDIAHIPGVKFKTANGYVAGNAQNLTPESIRQISITANGHTRYFREIANNQDIRATAWRETDENGTIKPDTPLWVGYAGYSGTPSDHSKQTEALMAVGKGQLNPEALGVGSWVEHLLTQPDAQNIRSVNVGAHSLGASQALTSSIAFNARGIATSSSLLIEPAGAKVEADVIRTQLADRNSELYKSLKLPAGKEYTQAQFDQLVHGSTSVRTISFDTRGTPQYSNTARLQIGPGPETFANNAQTISSGRSGTDIDPGNQLIGDNVLYLNMAGQPVVSTSVAGKRDQRHALSNIGATLQNNEQLASYDQIRATGKKTEEDPQVVAKRAAADDISKHFPNYLTFLGEVGQKAADNPNVKASPEIQRFFKSVQDNPDSVRPFAAYVDKLSPDERHQLVDALTSNSGAVTDPKKTEQLMKLALSDPKKFGAIVVPGAQLSKKVSDLDAKLAEHPELASLTKIRAQIAAMRTAQGNTDFTRADTAALTKQFAENTALVDQISGVVDVMSTHPLTAQALDGALDKYMVNGKLDTAKLKANPTMAGFLDKDKLAAFAEETEKLLHDHPTFGKTLVDSIDPTKPADPKTAAMFAQLYNDPSGIAKLNTLLTENPDAEGLITGKINPMMIAMDSDGFTKRNPTLFKGVRDPLINNLIASTKFGQENPEIVKALKTGQAEKMLGFMKALGFGGSSNDNSPSGQQQGQDNSGPDIMKALASGDISAIIGAVFALLMGGSGGGFDMKSLMAGGPSTGTGRS